MNISNNLKRFLQQKNIQQAIDNHDTPYLIVDGIKHLNILDTYIFFQLLHKINFEDIDRIVYEYYSVNLNNLGELLIAFISSKEIEDDGDLTQVGMKIFELSGKHRNYKITIQQENLYIQVYTTDGYQQNQYPITLRYPCSAINRFIELLFEHDIDITKYKG